jgi:threonine synthase
MSGHSQNFIGLKCRECGRQYPKEALYVCEYCFGPLEVEYDYDFIKSVISRKKIESRPANMWRYRELLPIEGEVTVGFDVGFTPLVKAERLAKELGVREVWVKNDGVNYPTLSFKDRVVSVALTRAKEFGFGVVACASTGNLANSVAANAASVGLRSYVLIPHDLEASKILGSSVYGTTVVRIDGTYDDVNRLCSEIAGRYNWAFVNVNLRPYYAEGSKAFGFEIAEQLGWRLPDHVIVPMAGGSLITKIYKAFKELQQLGLVAEKQTRIHGAQAENCAPIINALKADADFIWPVKEPNTIVKSLAIGNPADGIYAIQTMKETGGWGEAPSDREVIDGMKLLARTAGIFGETAGGVVVGAARRLLESGHIGRDDSVVLANTGNGLKTKVALDGQFVLDEAIKPGLADFENLLNNNKSVTKSTVT